MQTLEVEAAQEANYTLYKTDDSIAYSESYSQLETIFSQCKSAFARVGECSVPYYWAPTILEAVRKMVALDPKLILVNINEKNSKLVLSLWYPSRNDTIRDLLNEVKNDIDQLVHDRVRKMLVQRKFNYVPEAYRKR